MARWVQTAWLVVAIGACGGQPVGSKVPKADPTKMAIGAAAAASALTLANPDSAGRRAEQQGEEKPKKIKKTGEKVSAGALDRLDEAGAVEEGERPCEPTVVDEPPADKARVEFIPKVPNENREAERRRSRRARLEMNRS
jgi:hypothetical protein